MLISAPYATGEATGSLIAGAPAGIVIEFFPPKVTLWMEPGWTPDGSVGTAAVREPTRRGEEPYSFVRRMRN
jgi:hypothetical protein